MHVRVVALSFLLVGAAFAEPLQLKIVSPDHQPVAGARVDVHRPNSAAIKASARTDARGIADLDLPTGRYDVEVLAPGFARTQSHVSLPVEEQTVTLSVAGPAETVQVTASGTPQESVNAGADVTTLSGGEIEHQLPTAMADLLRNLPGAIVSDAGQRGGISSLFVRGGESRYNKVIIDGVPVNEVGGTYDFGTTSPVGADRVEFMRGAQSTLYGSDAMTSVVQVFSAQGATHTPELRLGADGGTFQTADGYASLAGAIRGFDFNLFGDQFNTSGQEPNDDFGNASQGANIGYTISPKAFLRFRTRHENSRAGVQGEWVFGGQAQLPPDLDGYARDNKYLSSLEFSFSPSTHWRHTFTGYEYNQRRLNSDQTSDRGCDFPYFLDCPFSDTDHQNRAGFHYQGEWTPLAWSTTTFGYDFEDENGFISDNFSGSIGQVHGLRRNHAGYVEQSVIWKRFSATAGVRALHNESFGNKAVPRVAASFLAARGGDFLSGTRFRFTYAEGFLEPSFDEQFGFGAFGTLPNPNLQPEENRALEAGVDQQFLGGKFSLTATYFNNLFHNIITFETLTAFTSQYINLDRSMAHGAELGFHTRLRNTLRLDAAYTYDSTQILSAPLASDPTALPGRPLLRRPKHSGSLLLDYSRSRWGGTLGGSFIGRRPDSDFLYGAVPAVDHTAGYALVNLGSWYELNSRITIYGDIDNLLNRRYEEVAGYPALKANFRAGMRFRIGGE